MSITTDQGTELLLADCLTCSRPSTSTSVLLCQKRLSVENGFFLTALVRLAWNHICVGLIQTGLNSLRCFLRWLDFWSHVMNHAPPNMLVCSLSILDPTPAAPFPQIFYRNSQSTIPAAFFTQPVISLIFLTLMMIIPSCHRHHGSSRSSKFAI